MSGISFRSIFPQGDGTPQMFARGYGDSTIFVQDSPGVFIDYLELTGGTLDPQSSVVWDPMANEFIAFFDGTLNRWDGMGAFVGTTTFIGYGMNPGEPEYPQYRGVAWAHGCYLTHNSGMLSAWDPMGNRVDTTTLNAAGTNLTANISLSYANDHVWISDETTWRGYQVF